METVGEGAERRVAPNAEERAEVLMLAIVCTALAASLGLGEVDFGPIVYWCARSAWWNAPPFSSRSCGDLS